MTKRCTDIMGQWHGRGTRRISLPHRFFSRLTHNKYRTHKGQREMLQYVGINSWSTENRVAKSYFELFLTGEMNRESDLTLPG